MDEAMIVEEMAEAAWDCAPDPEPAPPEAAESTILRVTVRQLADATAPGGRIMLHGAEPSHVVLIGRLISAAPTATFIKYTLDDSTGTVVATYWIDDEVPVPTVVDGTAIRVVAKPRWAEGAVQLTAVDVRSPEDPDEVEYNLLSARHHELSYKVASGLPVC
jgi:hypothetical protein